MRILTLVLALFSSVVAPAVAIDLFDPGIPPFPDGQEPTFNTTSFDIGSFRTLYSARSGAHGQILVNRQDLGTGAWTYDPSRVAVDMNAYDTGMVPSVALGSVLRASGRKFRHPSTGVRYDYVMYFIYQGSETPDLAGTVCMAFSSDAIQWTDPIYPIYQHTGGPRGTRCGVDAGDAFYNVKAEAVAGFLLTSNSLHLWHLEGDLALLESQAGSTSNSLTWYDTTTADDPDVFQRHGQVTLGGVDNLNRPGSPYHGFFANLDATYDPATGQLYLLRVYPAPFDPDDPTTPCNHGLRTDYATLPTHGQAYSMQVNGDPSLSIDAGRSWSKVAEFGQFYGHTTEESGSCTEYLVRGCIPNNEYLYNSGNRGNLNMVSVHKTPRGFLATDAQGLVLLYFQTTDRNPPFVDVNLMAGWFTTVASSIICV